MKKIVSTLINPPSTNKSKTLCAIKGCNEVADNSIQGLLYDGEWTEDSCKGNFFPICPNCAAEAGYIKADSKIGRKLGFISSQFHGYLYLHDKIVHINMLNVTPNFKEKEEEMYFNLFLNILHEGYQIQLMNVSLVMEKAAGRIGYTKHTGTDFLLKVPYSYIRLNDKINTD